jgi:hypothetical protein
MWALIEEINWKSRSRTRRGYEGGKQFLLDNFTKETCDALRDFAKKQKNALYVRVANYESDYGRCGNYGGDDSYDDMLWHVVGLGEDIYNMIMDNPKLLDRIDFVESFSYCLSYEYEYEKELDDPELADAKELIRALVVALIEDGQEQLEIVDHAKKFLGV